MNFLILIIALVIISAGIILGKYIPKLIYRAIFGTWESKDDEWRET